MKYLKQFNENKDEYYTKLLSYNPDFKYISISKQSVDYITNLFPDIEGYGYVDGKIPFSSFHPNYNSLSSINFWYRLSYSDKEVPVKFFMEIFKKLEIILCIKELEDEYFIVNFNDKSGNVSYKCDQLDGVKELLVDFGYPEWL